MVEREVGRLAEYDWRPGDPGVIPGGCGWLSEIVERDYGWSREGGCYLTTAGHIDHFWNRLPDDAILDASADQFGEDGDGIRITRADDPRYEASCPCPEWDGQVG